MTFRARRTMSRTSLEVVDQDDVRVAYLPHRDSSPATTQRRARIIAAALSHDELTGEKLRIIESMPLSSIMVLDGEMRLASFGYASDDPLSRDIAQSRATAFTDGYLVARRLCLGERE